MEFLYPITPFPLFIPTDFRRIDKRTAEAEALFARVD